MSNTPSKQKEFSFGFDKAEIERRKVLQDGEAEISDRSFQLIFGGMIAWGLILNAVMVYFLRVPMMRMMLSMENPNVLLIGGLIGYLVLVIAGSVMLRAHKAVTSFIGFNLIAAPVGIVLTLFLMRFDSMLILRALVLTATIVVGMMLAATLFPQFFLGMGRILGITLIITLLASALGTLFFGRALGFSFGLYDYGIAALFSLYIGFDWARFSVVARTRNNAMELAAAMYLDIVNLFIRVVSILAKKKD